MKIRKNNANKTGIIHLSDLVRNKNYKYLDKFYVELDSSSKKELYQKVLKCANTIRNLSKETKISFTRLWDQLTRVPFSIETLNQISKYLRNKGFKEYSLRNIEKKVLYIKGGFTSEKIFIKFPINLKTKEGIRLISHIYHDGGIGKVNRQPNYTNQNISEIQEFLKDAQKLFGKFNRKITKDINLKSKKEYYRISLPTVIGDILISIGYKAGDKTKENSKVFKFLKEIKDKTLIKEYLSKAFNDDGCVCNRYINLEQSSLIKEKIKPSNILILNKLFLKRLGIKTIGPKLTKKYKNRYGIVTKFDIRIYSKENIQKFYDNIRLIEHKNKKIENYLINWGLRKNKRDIYI